MGDEPFDPRGYRSCTAMRCPMISNHCCELRRGARDPFGKPLFSTCAACQEGAQQTTVTRRSRPARYRSKKR